MKYYYVYSKKNGTLYTGVTGDLIKRAYQHKKDLIPGFTNKYGVHKLVYFEQHGDIINAIIREKQIKKWRRDWKINLIERNNPEWRDLYYELV